MGAGYDDSRKIAYPRYEQAYLDSGMLSQNQIDNRQLLRDVMRSGGFWNIQTEWWHFNRYSRDRAKEMYNIIE
jgi:D-alanyl-D-alanine dipeptidase